MIPLPQAKAELFRTLGHPVRIRVLELLRVDVADLMRSTRGVLTTMLSGQEDLLAQLRAVVVAR